MAETVASLLMQNLLNVFGEPDVAKRRAVIATIWADDGVFVDAQGRHVGHEALSDAVGHLYKLFPGFVFTPIGAPEAFHGIGRLAWGHGPAGASPGLTGIDIVAVRDGRIASLYTFINPVVEG